MDKEIFENAYIAFKSISFREYLTILILFNETLPCFAASYPFDFGNDLRHTHRSSGLYKKITLVFFYTNMSTFRSDGTWRCLITE